MLILFPESSSVRYTHDKGMESSSTAHTSTCVPGFSQYLMDRVVAVWVQGIMALLKVAKGREESPSTAKKINADLGGGVVF